MFTVEDSILLKGVHDSLWLYYDSMLSLYVNYFWIAPVIFFLLLLPLE